MGTLMNCRPIALACCWLVLSAWLTIGVGHAQVVDKRLRDKDPAVRQQAIEELTEEGGERAEEWLLRALGDDDWGVALAAAQGLAKQGGKAAVKPLANLALKGPTRAIRQAAARSLARVGGAAGVDALMRKLGSKQKVQVADALGHMASQGIRPESVKALEKLSRHKDRDLQPVGAKVWLACTSPDAKPEVLRKLLDSERLLVRSEAAEALILAPDPGCIPALVEALAGSPWNPVVERRLIRALVACVGAVEDVDERQGAVLTSVVAGLGSKKPGGARCAQFLAQSVQGETPWLNRDSVFEALRGLADAKSGEVRGAAYRALAKVGDEKARDLLIERLKDETQRKCIEPLVRSLVKVGGLDSEAGVAAMVRCLQKDHGTRGGLEALCVALAKPGLDGVETVLHEVLEAADWQVAVTAAVAIGKGRGPRALEILRGFQEHSDWRLRGASAVGLMHLAVPGAFETLMTMRTDESPSVALSAERGLQRMAGREGQGEPPMGWQAWWDKHGSKRDLRAMERSLRSHQKYGYEVPDSLIYSGLDVVVIPGRGDKIESVLDRLNISYRTVQAGQLAKTGLHPQAVLIVGCTGEIHDSDIEVVKWYVRCGGALFTSCWSLTHTANRAFPGTLRQFTTQGEVMDQVKTKPAQAASPLLNGVFSGGSVPIYQLQGAHLIEVVDPLRTEVLIDSPEAADRHGSGEMAAWFWAGHGTVLDSVNHFDLQGLAMASHLRKAKEMQAYAVDHMGLSIRSLRNTVNERWWKKRMQASEMVHDLSAFRLLTNFVREKRLRGD